MKALIIGAAGFVGGHLIDYLCLNESIETFVTKLYTEEINNACIKRENIFNLDICDSVQTKNVLEAVKPDYIFHLAAQSSVSLSWKEPALTYNINVLGTINILEALRVLNVKSRLLIIGSSEEYGRIEQCDLPINEYTSIKPINPYAASKASQEVVSKLYIQAYGLDIVMVRAFNHFGPGQSPVFVISDFAKQIAEIEKNTREPIIYTGNLEVKRDFTDVRDIVKGYYSLVRKGVAGEIYNIGSGKSHSIRELLYKMIRLSGRNIEIKNDPTKFRPVEIPEICADIGKIKLHIGWVPEIAIDTTLQDTLNFWRA